MGGDCSKLCEVGIQLQHFLHKLFFQLNLLKRPFIHSPRIWHITFALYRISLPTRLSLPTRSQSVSEFHSIGQFAF